MKFNILPLKNGTDLIASLQFCVNIGMIGFFCKFRKNMYSVSYVFETFTWTWSCKLFRPSNVPDRSPFLNILERSWANKRSKGLKQLKYAHGKVENAHPNGQERWTAVTLKGQERLATFVWNGTERFGTNTRNSSRYVSETKETL